MKRAAAVVRGWALIDAGVSRLTAERTAAREHKVCRGSVMRWLKTADALQLGGDGTLIPCRGAGRPATVWSKHGAALAFSIYCTYYLRAEQPGSMACWRRVEKIAKRRAWTVPCEAMFRRRLYAEVPYLEIVRARKGRVVAAQIVVPAQERSVAELALLEVVNGDGYTHNVFVWSEDGKRVLRPVTWFWQEARVRKILAHRSGETENSDLVRLSFVDFATEVGCCDQAIIDNTAVKKWLASDRRRGWRSDAEDVKGVFEQIGVKLTRTRVEREDDGRNYGWGQSKPVERAFRSSDLGELIDKHPLLEGCHTGSSPNAKPANYRTRAVPWEVFLAVVEEGVRDYNAQAGRRMEIANGRSIDEAWSEEYAGAVPRWLTAEQRGWMLLAAESTRIQKDGTFTIEAGKATGLPRNRYYHRSLLELARRRPENRKVLVRFDPQALHDGVGVYTLDNAWMCHAECRDKVGLNDTRAARDINRQRAREMRALDKAHEAREGAREVAEKHGVRPAPATRRAKPGALRLVTEPRRRNSEAAEAARESTGDEIAQAALQMLDGA